MSKICDSVLGSIPVGADFKSEKVAVKDFDEQIDGLVSAYLKEVGETVGSLKGDMWIGEGSFHPYSMLQQQE